MTKCNICQGELNQIISTQNSVSVSSDNKIIKATLFIYKCKECSHIQKIKDNQIQKVYEEYKKDDLVEGQDQTKFIDGKPFFRTDILVSTIISSMKNKKTLLDIGTGTGVFLLSCNKYLNLDLYAFDLNTRYKSKIEAMENVKKFYTNDLKKIDKSFDIISLIHVFEHIEKPLEALKVLKSKLNKNGIIIIQVPSITENPNDILIYDHYSHFSKNSLFNLLKKVFTNIEFIKTNIKNEITVIIKNDNKKSSFTQQEEQVDFSFLNKAITYLNNIEKEIYVFGTAPTSTYYASILNEHNKLKGFLDEDPLKQNKTHLDKEIFHPKDLKEIVCFFPLSQNIYNDIKKKYPNITFISIQDI
ncbi:class I SAM-dependent methyltransferase [Arcobacter roscoffensis]|uniref:Class I SAM-dependent methyltransferase n=1 Tax=Arcobacter roscoffensis TaxID=2961520 RepID=A0ABY5E3D2_9BACT|nr:class I SAM-dependent methyltransferase [Arcobacter roscoffensis]UTJ06382.1 class I SAM-dependent methyltransferase [Arcobacter roscoffensis]